jgi:hypothetical protein
MHTRRAFLGFLFAGIAGTAVLATSAKAAVVGVLPAPEIAPDLPLTDFGAKKGGGGKGRGRGHGRGRGRGRGLALGHRKRFLRRRRR